MSRFALKRLLPVKRNVFVFVTLAVTIGAMLAAAKYLNRSRPPIVSKMVGDVHGKPAPNFELTALDGHKIKLSDYRGKAVVLNFWATWCPPCKVEMPWLVDLQKQYGNDGLAVLGVAMDDTATSKIAEFAKEMNLNYTVLVGTDQVSEDYGNVQYLPTTFYIDRNGEIVDKVAGLLSRREIEDDVKKALNHTSESVSASSAPEAPARAIRSASITGVRP